MNTFEDGGYCDEWFTLRDLLDDIDRGDVKPIPDEPPGHHFTGDLRYTFDKYPGWEIWVFNDCISWDYIDHIVTPDGVKYDNFLENTTRDSFNRKEIQFWALIKHWAPRDDKAWGF